MFQGTGWLTLQQFTLVLKALAEQRAETLGDAVARMMRSEGLRKLERVNGAAATALLRTAAPGAAKKPSKSNPGKHSRKSQPGVKDNEQGNRFIPPGLKEEALVQEQILMHDRGGPAAQLIREGVFRFWGLHKSAMRRIFVEYVNRDRNMLQKVKGWKEAREKQVSLRLHDLVAFSKDFNIMPAACSRLEVERAFNGDSHNGLEPYECFISTVWRLAKVRLAQFILLSLLDGQFLQISL